VTPLRIVLVMIEPPLPFGNATARWYYVLLKELVQRGHRVTAYAACSKPEEIAKARDLFPAPAYDLRLYPFPTRSGFVSKIETLRRPYSYMFSPELKADLACELATEFDLLHLEQLSCVWLARKHADRGIVNVHYLAIIDLAELAATTLLWRFHRWLLMRSERKLIREFKHFLTNSPRLVPLMLHINPSATIDTVPLGIDIDQYPFIPDSQRTNEPILSVIGSMNWHPSRSAVVRLLRQLWPEIKRRVPDARVQIVGWSARSSLAKFIDMPDVIIEENVPDTRSYFEQTGVMLYAPARGSGMKIKILEAFAYGVPVVTTSEGVEGIPAIDGVHASVAEDDAGLIERAVNLLQNPEQQNRQRAEGRQLLERHCGPKPTVDAIEAVYAKMMTKRGEERSGAGYHRSRR